MPKEQFSFSFVVAVIVVIRAKVGSNTILERTGSLGKGEPDNGPRSHSYREKNRKKKKKKNKPKAVTDHDILRENQSIGRQS